MRDFLPRIGLYSTTGTNCSVKALKLIIGRLAFPAHSFAPLLSSETRNPLIIFSHGLAGTRHTYTQYCSALASRGYIVLAVEHRDGSAPAVTLPSTTDTEGKELQRVLGYIKKDEIVWGEGETGTLEKFRTAQLEMRVREVYEAFYSFKRIVAGDVTGLTFEKLHDEKRKDWLESIREKVDFGKVDLTGHSFGAGTIVGAFELNFLPVVLMSSFTSSTLPYQTRHTRVCQWVELSLLTHG